MKTNKLKFIIATSLIYAFAAIITVKVNYHIDIQKLKCKKDSSSVKYCKILNDPYLPNILIFFSTFFSTLLLYFIFYYVLDIDF